MGDAKMMFVSLTRLIKLDAFVNKKNTKENKTKRLHNHMRKKKDIDDRQRFIFSAIV